MSVSQCATYDRKFVKDVARAIPTAEAATATMPLTRSTMTLVRNIEASRKDSIAIYS